MSDVKAALVKLFQHPDPVEYDPEWTSPCEILPPDEEGMVDWQPVPMDPPADMDGLSVHPSIREFYGSFWAGSIEGSHSGECVLLSLAWNAEELEQIIATIQFHIAEGAPVYVAGTDSDWYFGVDNATGAVWLCEPGHPPIRQVATSLAEFLAGVR